MKKIWITNGKEIHRINENEFEIYRDKGFRRGKKKNNSTYTAWNKGLTQEDARVLSYVQHKPKHYNKIKAVKEDTKCSICKKEIKVEYDFCPYCGKKFV